MWEWLKGKKAYIVGVLIPITAYLQIKGIIGADEVALITGILTGLGLMALRHGISTEAKKANGGK